MIYINAYLCLARNQSAITCSKLIIETLEQGVSLTYFTPWASASIVNFQQVNAGWGISRSFERTKRRQEDLLCIKMILVAG